MTLKKWEKKVLAAPGAERRVSEIERELRIAAGLAELREDAGMTQRAVAKKIGVSQPRVAAIEQSKNITIEVLQQYVESLGARLEVTAVKGNKKIPLLSGDSSRRRTASRPARTKASAAKKTGHGTRRRSAEAFGGERRERPRVSFVPAVRPPKRDANLRAVRRCTLSGGRDLPVPCRCRGARYLPLWPRRTRGLAGHQDRFGPRGGWPLVSNVRQGACRIDASLSTRRRFRNRSLLTQAA